MRRVLGAMALLPLVLASPATAGAADPPDPGKTFAGTVTADGREYEYLRYTPASSPSDRPAPLLVMVHGCQTSAEQEMRITRFNQLAERERFVVLYPDVDEAQRALPGPANRCWRFPDPDAWRRGRSDAGAIAGMTRAVMDKLAIDPERVYIVGVSAGGLMAAVQAAAYPDLYAAVGIVQSAGYADWTCFTSGAGIPVATSAQMAYDEMGERARVVPRFVIGSDADQAFPASCSDKATEQGLRTNNLVISRKQDGPIALKPAAIREASVPGGYGYTVSTYRDPDGCLVGERTIIHGMPHAWPGGTTDPEYDGYTDVKAPSGAEISWAFLHRFTRRDTAMPCAEAPRATRCAKQLLVLRLPSHTVAATAAVNGRRVPSRIRDGRLRLRLPSGRRTSTVVATAARTRSGKLVKRRYSYRGCGPSRGGR